MSTLDKVNWVLLIVWASLIVSVFIKGRQMTHKPSSFSLYASNMGMAIYFSILVAVHHLRYISAWWDTLGVVIGIGSQGYLLWRIWRESNKEREKAIS